MKDAPFNIIPVVLTVFVAMAIAGGVLLSTIVSFYLVPPMFALLMTRGGQAPELVEASETNDNNTLQKSLA